MNNSSANGFLFRRRVLRRLARDRSLALFAALALQPSPADQPAQAAGSATNAHVYVTNLYPWAIHYETTPADAPIPTYYRPATSYVQLPSRRQRALRAAAIPAGRSRAP